MANQPPSHNSKIFVPQTPAPSTPSSNGTQPAGAAPLTLTQFQDKHFMPPVGVVHTWNTKRILPQILLSQYTPFATLFLIDDTHMSQFTAEDFDMTDSIIVGSPVDTVTDISEVLLRNPTGLTPRDKKDDPIQATQYFADTIKNNIFRVGTIKGIPAKLVGYFHDQPVKLIPLSLKLPQLASPDGKIPLELQDAQVQFVGNNHEGFGTATLTLVSYDMNQLFAIKSVLGKVFQNFQTYLLVFGWQGPSIENIDLGHVVSNTPGLKSAVVSGANSISLTLLDGTPYDLFLPTPFVRQDGMINYPFDEAANQYVIDVNDTDNGNRQVMPLYGVTPRFQFDPVKTTITLQMSSAGKGFNIYNPISIFTGGQFTDVRNALVKKVNGELKPIATFNIAKFFDPKPGETPMYDAETNQEFAKAWWNEINARDGAGTLLVRNVTGDNSEDLSTNEKPFDYSYSSSATTTATNPPPVQPKPSVPPKPKKTIDTSKMGWSPSFKSALRSFQNKLIASNDAYLKKVGNAMATKLDSIEYGIYGFRSYKLQKQAYNNYVSGKGAAAANPDKPNSAKHMNGVAADLSNAALGTGFSKGLSAATLEKANTIAQSVGLIFPYSNPYASEGSRHYEPWHIEPMGGSVIPNTTSGNVASTVTSDADFDDDEAAYLAANEVPPQTDVESVTKEEVERAKNDGFDPEVKDTSGKLTNPNSEKTKLSNIVVKKENLTQIPAAYRLGDVITCLTEVMDEYFIFHIGGITDGVLQGVKTMLGKAGINELTLDGQKVKTEDLTDAQVFDKDLQPTPAFDKAIADLKLPSSDDASNLILTARKGTPLSQSLGYDIITPDANSEGANNFRRFLNHFKNMLGGNKINELGDLARIRFPNLLNDLSTNVFSWDKDYIDSFTSNAAFEPISVADIPISVDTLSRVFQSIQYMNSIQNFVDSLLTAVSIDYGFALRSYHRTIGASYSPSIKTLIVDYEYEPKKRRKTDTAKQVIDQKTRDTIDLIIEDEFFVNKKVIEAIKDEQSTVNSVLSLKTNVNSQPTVFGNNLLPTEVIPHSNDDVDYQMQFLSHEFSKEKMNGYFNVDHFSAFSLVKSLSLQPSDSSNSMAYQVGINNTAKYYQNSGGMYVPPKLTDDQKAAVGNFSKIQGAIAKNILDKYKILPGTPAFEIRFISAITEVYDDIIAGKVDDLKAAYTSVELQQAIEELQKNTDPSKIGAESREEFLTSLVQTYLYNRPMGVKEQFYDGRMNVTIHGTTGLGFMQGIYYRGLLASLDGIYRINAVTHVINSGFFTSLDAGLVQSDVQLATQKLVSKIYNNQQAADHAKEKAAQDKFEFKTTDNNPDNPPANPVGNILKGKH